MLTHAAALILRGVRLRGILNHHQLVRAREVHDGVHIGGMAE